MVNDAAIERNTQKVRKAIKFGVPLVRSDYLNECKHAKKRLEIKNFLINLKTKPEENNGDLKKDNKDSSRKKHETKKEEEDDKSEKMLKKPSNLSSTKQKKKKQRIIMTES